MNRTVADLAPYQLSPGRYHMLVAAWNPRTASKPFSTATCGPGTPMRFSSARRTRYGRFLMAKYQDQANIRLIGGVYD